ncbi:heme lyase CcmF/NrfE family subunit [Oleiagrimonas sp. C23AA]|uniref:heme lyase CcmF/NrfE family subunit n=1 Tax=Oleiagrimonas sp. C23AA TaxID=2719047 RepID=UPI0014231BCE|nr:heme lyase CcmF/NrfE family subunit [Oleiagrimonas sp. C23AA]NII09445.1 heme lyase CcmF/NrfE family subunit [Oleiagrimonas sp. C23AA]
MIPELAQFALVLALLLALAQSLLPLAGAWSGSRALMSVARPAAYGQALFVAAAFVLLAYSFLVHDFSVAYVADNSNLALPWYYRIAAVWGAHEGSLLLWALILNVWTVALCAFSRQLPEVFASRVIAILGLISVGFLLFMLLTSDPFTRLLPAPANGADLNPVLQDPGMTFHPPVLYMGYVGFSVAFAFSIAALLGGGMEKHWVRWARPWTNVAWGFLSLGIVAGSWWAYAELGWGGWWFWDPVENASFMPWLVGAALIHAQAVTEKRGSLSAWTVLLSIFAFSLSLLGTFLVRSGVLTSVHAFASDPKRGVFILIFLAIVVGASLLLYAIRAPKVVSGRSFAGMSRETGILIGNLLLTVAAAMVLLGTLFPLIGDAFGWGRISVGPPYFGTLFILLMAPLVFLMPFGPFARWGRADNGELKRVLIHCALFGLIVGGVLIAWLWSRAVDHLQLVLGAVGAAYVLRGVIMYVLKRWRGVPRGRRYPAEMAGMLLAHLGVAVFLVGALLTNALSIERDVRMAPGKLQEIGGYQMRFEGVKHVKGPNWTAEQATVTVLDDGKTIAVMHPQKRTYDGGQIQTEAAVDAGITRDLYVAVGEDLGDGAWAMRLYDKPFIRWIWGGGVLMMAGGFIAAADRRFRVRRQVSDAQTNALVESQT